ncbi:MAG: nucleotide exchange factor GrpE [Bacteroidaceae bacterium]|nr:nucleotide exchange factor GrpE [Bacteroidaceae bacterium]
MSKNKDKFNKKVDPETEVQSEVDTEQENASQSEEQTQEAPEKKEPLTPEEQIAELEQQVADLKNAMLYKVAEFENYRKRTIKEKADLILNGGKKVMEALLPVADDLERAEQNIEKANDVEALKEGLQLVFQKFTKTLEGLGLKKMDVVGEDFSTDFHEAVAFVPSADEQKGKVIDCVQNGYMLNEQVIRFAKVAVGQ